MLDRIDGVAREKRDRGKPKAAQTPASAAAGTGSPSCSQKKCLKGSAANGRSRTERQLDCEYVQPGARSSGAEFREAGQGEAESRSNSG
jgi:hypothetical protein